MSIFLPQNGQQMPPLSDCLQSTFLTFAADRCSLSSCGIVIWSSFIHLSIFPLIGATREKMADGLRNTYGSNDDTLRSDEGVALNLERS